MKRERFEAALTLHRMQTPLVKNYFRAQRGPVPLVSFDFDASGQPCAAVMLNFFQLSHRQTFYEVIFSCCDAFSLEVGDLILRVDPFDLCIVSPDVEHQVLPDRGRTNIFSVVINHKPMGPYVFLGLISGCELLLNFFADAFRRSGCCNFLHVANPGDPDLKEAMLQLVVDSAERQRGNSRLVEADLSRLLILVEQRCNLASLIEVSTDNRLASAVYTYLSEHYATATLKSTAQALHYSPDHISAVLRREGWGSFHAKLRRFRLNQAIVLLTSSDLSATEIANFVGFASYSGFYKAFKSRYFISPAAFLKKYRETGSGLCDRTGL